MANSSHDLAATQAPAFTFAECYDALFQTPELAVYVIRAGGNGEFTFEDANSFVAQVAGKSLFEIRGQAVGNVLLPQIADCLIEHLDTVFATGEALAYERTLALPAGQVSFKTSLMPLARGPRGPTHVLGLTRDVTNEADLIDQAKHQAALLKTLGIALPSAVYVLDLETYALTFVGGEASPSQLEWRKGAEEVGPNAGQKYFHPEDWPRAQAHWQELAALQDGEVATISYRLLASEEEYSRHVHREVVLERDPDGRVKLVLGVSENFSEHDKVEQEARDLSARMLTLQIDERRRIAQELHDSTVQHLVAAGLALQHVRSARNGVNPEAIEVFTAIDVATHSLKEAQREIRVLSYLLHPPHLRSQGLAEAIESFARGFGSRAGLNVELSICPSVGKIGDETALHLFRVCQEALTNVYRHANAHNVSIGLEVDSTIRLTVADDGVGFNSSEAQILGVGLPGMHERITRLGGDLIITSDLGGTTLVATIPSTARPALDG